MSANTYELTYFPVKGLGNFIRILLEDHGVDYKFNLVTKETWPEHKDKTPFGQVPVLTVNGETQLAQSHTIARYLGRELGLMGGNSLEQAQVEMWVDQTLDIRMKLARMIYSNYESGLQPFLESVPTELAPFEKRLTSQEDKGHLLLGKATLADYALYDLGLILVALSADCLDKTPAVKAFFESFGARERLAAFVNRADIKEAKFTGSDHL